MYAIVCMILVVYVCMAVMCVDLVANTPPQDEKHFIQLC